MSPPSDLLEGCNEILLAGGFAVEERELNALGCVLVAETLYALVLVCEASSNTLVERAEDAQSALTHLAARHPSPRSWDLYVVLAVDDPSDPSFELIREEVEGNTRYARKLVVSGGRDSAELRLRPLLPLRPVPHIELSNPLAAVRDYLLAAEVDVHDVDAAISSFGRDGEVTLA
jgi:hypothetical protein